MNRRNLLSALAALPFIGAFVPKAKATGDGIALKSMAHPGDPFKIYAYQGETVTCVNGHTICKFAEHVCVGDIFRPTDLTDWEQEEPKVGQIPLPRCNVCGGRFYLGGNIFHIGKEWRDPKGLIAKYGMPKDS